MNRENYRNATGILTFDDYEAIKNACIDRKESFFVEEYGRIAKLYLENTKIKYSFMSDKDYVKGLHLVRRVQKDIDKYVEKHGIPSFSHHYNLSNINPYDLYDARNELFLISQDIRRCYWKTAYKLKFISKTTYQEGLKYKLAANISIGSLNKSTVVYTYNKGHLTDKFTLGSEQKYRAVYWKIINDLKSVMNRIMKLEGALLWTTDCVLFNPKILESTYDPENKTNEIDRILQKEGYFSSKESVEIVNISSNYFEYKGKNGIVKVPIPINHRTKLASLLNNK